MSRRAKGPRLYWHDGKAKWVIRDTGRPETATGTADRGLAEKALAAYIAQRDRPTGPTDPGNFYIADVLTYYVKEHGDTVTAKARAAYAIDALLGYWGKLTVSAITGATCRRYAKWRDRADGTVRRELGVLRAALNFCHKEGLLLYAPPVDLPDPPPAKDRWLTRDEAARLLWAAYRSQRGKHLARFILVGLYTGTRKQAILDLQFMPNTTGGWVDVENGVLYRRGEGQRETKKRRPPARLPRTLLAHLRRWKAEGGRYVVEYRETRIGNIQNGFELARAEAGLPDVTPHTLKHTAITWALQGGAKAWDAASFFGTSMQTIEKVYGHHSPDHQATAKEAMERKAMR